MTAWRNRIVGHGTEAPDQLLAHPKNWRVHPKAQQEALRGVLEEVGWVQDVVVNQRTGHVLDGHLRVQVAMQREEAEVPVIYVDVSEAEEALILATMDPLSALAVADKVKLDEILRDAPSCSSAVQEMLSQLAEDNGLISHDETEDAQEQWAPGIVYQFNLVFDDENEQSTWFRFLKWLKSRCDGETHGARLAEFAESAMASEGQ